MTVSGGSPERQPEEQNMYRIPRFAPLAAGLAAILLVPLAGVTGVAAQPADETRSAGSDPPSASADIGADIEVNGSRVSRSTCPTS
jgi:hypothetical protein